jgi:hypothetical protein
LSSDPVILDEMKQTAAGLFAAAPMVEFADDIAPVNALCQIDMKIILPGSTPSENRRFDQEVRDETIAKRDLGVIDGRKIRPHPPATDDSQDEIYKNLLNIQASKRTIQILGQVLRNSILDISGPDKRIIVHEIYRLGRRVLGMLFENFDADLPAWRDELTGHYRGQVELAQSQEEESKKYKIRPISERELLTKAHQHIYQLYWLATLGVISIVGKAVGMDMLHETFRGVLDEDNALPVRMFDMAIKLDRPGRFPKDEVLRLYDNIRDNGLIQLTLRSMVVNHFYLYDSEREDRQSVCSDMKISLPPQAANPKSKRLPPKSKRRGQ